MVVRPAERLLVAARVVPRVGRDRTAEPGRTARLRPATLGDMPERTRVVAVTGDDVVSFALPDERPDAVLRGVGARCVAIDPHDPDRWYVGTFDEGLFATSDGGRTWRAPE